MAMASLSGNRQPIVRSQPIWPVGRTMTYGLANKVRTAREDFLKQSGHCWAKALAGNDHEYSASWSSSACGTHVHGRLTQLRDGGTQPVLGGVTQPVLGGVSDLVCPLQIHSGVHVETGLRVKPMADPANPH
jgi:hypothetical protein